MIKVVVAWISTPTHVPSRRILGYLDRLKLLLLNDIGSATILYSIHYSVKFDQTQY